jgi:hypothetical protein
MRPLLALIGHRDGVEECPLLGVERTSQFDRAMFAVDPKRTSEPATGMPYKKTFCAALTRRCRSACEFELGRRDAKSAECRDSFHAWNT